MHCIIKVLVSDVLLALKDSAGVLSVRSDMALGFRILDGYGIQILVFLSLLLVNVEYKVCKCRRAVMVGDLNRAWFMESKSR